ncbi:hypothetical protein [Streptomyces sp. NBC_00203]|uniref:hypothetical protein n=1 Tax=Streptomyces sp. NBC_00203 TaxID=2975680 RepID=UPI00324B911D
MVLGQCRPYGVYLFLTGAAVTDQSDVLVVPAWLGPDKMFVMSKGKAYTFGLFAVASERVSFAADDQMPIDELRAGIIFEWPWFLGGGGCRLRGRSQSWIVAFGRPYPDAPAPGRETIEASANLLVSAGSWAGVVPDSLDLGLGILSDLFALAQTVGDIKKGRHTAEQVKGALTLEH